MSEGASNRETIPERLAEQYRLLMECATDYALVLLDSTGLVAEWNVGAERTFGYRADEIVGRSFAVFFPTEDAAGRRPEEDLHAAAATGRTEHERWYVRKDGGRLWCHGTLTMLRREGGMSPCFALVLRDQTERRSRIEALRESEERHRAISELTSDYNYALHIDADGGTTLEVVTEGFTRITGFTLEEVNARGGWGILIHPEDMDEALRGLRRVLSGEVSASILRLVTKQGAVRWVRNLNKPVWDAARSRVIRLIGAAQDVTERRQADEELRESRERLQTLSRQLIAAQENERHRLAHELHDEIGQSLTAIGIHLQAAHATADELAQPRLREALAIVDQAIGQVRHLSLDLRPSVLDDLGLEAALRWYADRQIRLAGLDIRLDIHLGGRRLPAELETACFRVVQEALTNVFRHAHARRVWIELQRRATVELTIRDDGIGFDPRTARQRSAEGASFGLLGMQERVELLGGELDVESRPGHGASIRVRFTTAATPTGEECISHETDPRFAGR
jgi:PAS domain S-box-containing protein